MKPSFLYMVRQRLNGKNFLYEFYFKGKKTLDVGCGNGEFMKLDKVHIEGIDLNHSAIEELKREGYKAELGEVSKLPYEDSSFERIHCRNVIEHLYPEVAYKMLEESARVLKSGGIMILGTEMVTDKFWGTFGHTKPYPPGAILKILRTATREEYEPIKLIPLGMVYLGEYYRSKLLYFLTSLVAFHLPFMRREYFMVLKKK